MEFLDDFKALEPGKAICQIPGKIGGAVVRLTRPILSTNLSLSSHIHTDSNRGGGPALDRGLAEGIDPNQDALWAE